MATRPKTKVQKVIKYAKGPDTTLNGSAPAKTLTAWRDSEDNPLSPTFMPLTERGERGKARWWALQERRKNTTSHGEYDP